MKAFLFLCITLISSVSLYAQDKADALQVVDQLFVGMHTRNADILADIFHESATLFSTSKNPEGAYTLTQDSVAAFINQITSIPTSVQIEERILEKSIQIDANLAQVFTPYEFYVNGKLSHCGANMFLLIYQNKTWKILNITDTRRKDCE